MTTTLDLVSATRPALSAAQRDNVERWVQALRYGGHEQSEGQLRRSGPAPGQVAYCVEGVGALSFGLLGDGDGFLFPDDECAIGSSPHLWFAATFGFHPDSMWRLGDCVGALSTLNDGYCACFQSHTFTELAEVIEQQVLGGPRSAWERLGSRWRRMWRRGH
ncbi:hypothetical protein D5S17_09310 [Pseudonocardiaceae bacterium YIM PH 21723]|nr:hypothetical protein D5S17_09310 [Pseudonocardiaceae bacterium YIM PH 21723]